MRLVLAMWLVAMSGCAIAASAAAQAPALTPISPAAPPAAPSGPKLGGYLQVRETFADATRLSATLNRARFSIDGPLPNRFTYRFLVELEAGATARTAGTVSLREANIRWAYAPVAFQAGQFKTPFSREYLIPVPALETPDFSAVVDTLAPKYDIGLMGELGASPRGVDRACGRCVPGAAAADEIRGCSLMRRATTSLASP